MATTNPIKTDRFWRGMAIVLIVVMAANLSLGYLRMVPTPPDAPAVEVRQLVVAPDPKLDRILPVVDFDNLKLEQALTDLMHQADLNLVVLWTPINDAGVGKDVPVMLHLKNVSVATALDTMLSLADPKHHIEWNEHGGVVTVATEDSLDKSQLTVRIYDVKHLVGVYARRVPATSQQAISQNQSSSQTQSTLDYSPEAWALDEIKKLITDDVATNSWKDNGGDVGWINNIGDLLIITQTEQAQRKIEALLKLVDSK